jgi:hypothetical protein
MIAATRGAFEMADLYTRTVPDFGEDGSELLGPPETSVADKFRRAALLMSMETKRLLQDPLHTLFPSVSPTGATGGRRIGFGIASIKNAGGDFSNLAGQYVGPNDMRASQLLPGYVPRQDWEKAVAQDPLAGWLGPMQKPASPQQPVPTGLPSPLPASGL